MKEKFLDIVDSFIKTSDLEEFASLLKEKVSYIKNQPLDFLIFSKDNITVIFNLLKDFFKRKGSMPKNTFIALFVLLSYAIGKKTKKFGNILNKDIDSDLVIGFCIYLVEKDIQNYLKSKGGDK